jgi:hypothetical protein
MRGRKTKTAMNGKASLRKLTQKSGEMGVRSV